MSWNPWEPEQYRYVVLQAAGDGENAQQVNRMAYYMPELTKDPRFEEFVWKDIDRNLLDKFGHVDRNRLRLKFPTNLSGDIYWGLWARQRDSEVWGDRIKDLAGIPTYLLDGPFVGNVLRTKSYWLPIRIPKNDGTELEYTLLDYGKGLRAGVLSAERRMMPPPYTECHCGEWPCVRAR